MHIFFSLTHGKTMILMLANYILCFKVLTNEVESQRIQLACRVVQYTILIASCIWIYEYYRKGNQDKVYHANEFKKVKQKISHK